MKTKTWYDLLKILQKMEPQELLQPAKFTIPYWEDDGSGEIEFDHFVKQSNENSVTLWNNSPPTHYHVEENLYKK